MAHVGSPTVFFQGLAGKYPVRVTIEPPGVVPGLAQIHVVVSSGDVRQVSVRPVRWDVGVKGSPSPDIAVLVPGETNMFSAQLWLMASGAYSVFVQVSGAQGDGTAIVPLNSVASQRLVMSPGMAALFAVAGSFVVILLVTIVGAAIREGRVPPGEEISESRQRRGWYGRGIAAALILTALFLGNKWWDIVDKDFRFERLYQPQSIQTKLDTDAAGHQQLTLEFLAHFTHRFHSADSRSRAADAPVPDSRTGRRSLRAPASPASISRGPGQNRHHHRPTPPTRGTKQTKSRHHARKRPDSNAHQRIGNPAVRTPHPDTQSLAESDDAVSLSAPTDTSRVTFSEGFRLDRDFPNELAVNQETNLVFHLTTESGGEATLEPYLGMYGHLIIENADGTVFNHLHPLGSVSMVSQRQFAEREKAGYLANKPLDQFCTAAVPELSFPYAFPKAGVYRLWLQTKTDGHILTGGYTLTVK